MRRELRDHSEPCEHGHTDSHGTRVSVSPGEWMAGERCPGGKLVVMESEWRCEQGEAYYGPCSETFRTNYPKRHRTCGFVWVEVTP